VTQYARPVDEPSSPREMGCIERVSRNRRCAISPHAARYGRPPSGFRPASDLRCFQRRPGPANYVDRQLSAPAAPETPVKQIHITHHLRRCTLDWTVSVHRYSALHVE